MTGWIGTSLIAPSAKRNRTTRPLRTRPVQRAAPEETGAYTVRLVVSEGTTFVGQEVVLRVGDVPADEEAEEPEPTEEPTPEPTEAPTEEPTEEPTSEPTEEPTPEETEETEEPTAEPTETPAPTSTAGPPGPGGN